MPAVPVATRPGRRVRSAPRARPAALLLLLPLVLLAVAGVAALAFGARAVDPTTALHTLGALLTGQPLPEGIDAAAVASRVPRTVTAALVGAALAVAGAAMQGATRNPLGDPGLLGLSGGASLAMAVGLALGLPASAPAALGLAVLGTLGAAVVVYACAAAATRIGGTPGAPSPIALVLAGAAVTAGTTALTTALLVLSPAVRDRLRFWSIGTVARAELSEALALAPVILAAVLAAVAVGSGLDALALGDDLAHGLGAHPGRVRGVLLAAVVVLTAAAVALAGPVAFVGLVVPHALRRLRPSGTRLLLGGCALWGAVLLIAADLLGRTVVAPAEVHLGVTTVLLGVPVLLLLLRRTGVSA
ncbi:iron ABC transporter permease [Micrococcus sp. FDAARGOS_333]|uniref:FecCD family ABC transporter permease n=1 Tax=Micrococcus sp. FDAARGOS_333 TaxID=1930558 RepID=UPI000B4E7763|nr:iron chelate uptake ABC transporter family permease subunit [Micrococcus sp. FDAARGOS_333]PNL16911.1 iron ABC transporter permease [Micrococcus sp. FDAARGOS_333]